jgi:predicted DNA-binding transcriptional regulator YafY
MMRKNIETKPIARQWLILVCLLRSRSGVAVRDLQEKCGVSRATLYNDLKILRAHFTIDTELRDGKAWLILLPTNLPGLVLSEEQILALETARRLLSQLDGTALLDAYNEILAALGRPVRRGPLTPARERQRNIRRAVDDALRRRRRLEFSYVRAGETTRHMRTVDPIGWRLVADILYLLAFDESSDEWRSFAASRIGDAVALSEEAIEFDEPLFAAERTLAQYRELAHST